MQNPYARRDAPTLSHWQAKRARRHMLVAWLIGGLLAAAPRPSGAADAPQKFDEEIARKYAGVTEWEGFFEATETGGTAWERGGGQYAGSVQSERTSHGHFILKRSQSDDWDPAHGNFHWGGDNREIAGSATAADATEYAEWGRFGDGQERRDHVSGTVPVGAAEFEIRLEQQTARVGVGSPKEPQLTFERIGRVIADAGGGDGLVHLAETSLNKTEKVLMFLPPLNPNYWTSKAAYRVAAGGPGMLIFACEGSSRADTQRSTPVLTHRSRVMLVPVYDDVEVEVTIDGYAKWRPKGSIEDPTKPGNGLVAHAVLKSKNGKTKTLPEVERFRFELIGTSREPGVCLNSPLQAKDEDYDLKLADFSAGSSPEQLAAARKFFTDWGLNSSGDFDLASMPAGGIPALSFGEVSEGGQKAELATPPKDKAGQPYADAAIESFDFGGRAELRVTCILRDGREIIGLMKADGASHDIVRLPKRAGPDWIAESWRKENRAESLATNDDNESVAGQKQNGDGFTLYEEYRGWAVNGKHVEGDPRRKDFFVLNMIGADGRAGIALFEKLSELRVHSRIRRWEMSADNRLMNGNHREGPHRVDQHGVWVRTFTRATLGDNGADTPMTKAGVAGRPGITKGVGILSRTNTESIFNQPFNLPAVDTIFAYDRAIAHELLHAVGVEHHGQGDYRTILGYVSPRNPINKIGRPYYGSSPDKPVPVLTEEGHDLATKNYEQYVKMREFADLALLEKELAEGRKYIERNGVGYGGFTTPAQYADLHIELLIVYPFMHLDGTVGIEHGEHSGAQDCVMRYYFAKFYPARGRSDGTLYQVTAGTDRIGLELCRATRGTGINAAGRVPQSRHGDAAAGDGDCFSQICPNDAIPPRTVP